MPQYATAGSSLGVGELGAGLFLPLLNSIGSSSRSSTWSSSGGFRRPRHWRSPLTTIETTSLRPPMGCLSRLSLDAISLGAQAMRSLTGGGEGDKGRCGG
jgi:hypothetical protein